MRKATCGSLKTKPGIVLSIIAGLIFLSTSLVSHSQSEAEKGLPFITNYSAKTFKALPQAWCVQEDDRGMMYFGIQSYILEYDGVKWRKIMLGNSASNVVRSLTKNKEGVIYYGGYGDLGYLKTDSLGQFQAESIANLIPEENRNFLDIWSAYATDNSVYFQSREYIFRISDPGENSADKRTVKVWKPETRFMYSFYIDGDYFVHQQGLGLYKMTNDSLMLVPGSEFLGKERMQIMLPYPDGPGGEKQWIVGMFYSGLYIYNGKAFKQFPTQADDILKSGTILYKGIRLRNGNYVFSTTGKGLVVLDARGRLLQKINREVGLQDESVYATYLDKKGMLWLALDNGISRVETASPLTQFTLQSGINTGVLSMIRFNGNLYVGTSNGLLVFDSIRHFFEPITEIPQNQIFTLTSDEDELLVPGDGLFGVKNRKAYAIRRSVSANLTLSALYISKKYPNILVGGGTSGLSIFYRTGKNDSWIFAGFVPGIREQVWSFSENQDGTIWAGSANSVAYRLTLNIKENGVPDVVNTRVETFGPEQGIQDITGIVFNVNGNSYFIADSSLYRFDDARKTFVRDSMLGTFPDGGAASEFAFVEDQKGRVWIRAGKLVRLATPKPGGGYDLDDSQLNSLVDYTVQNFYPENNGIVWICTTDGLIRYDENLEKNYDVSFKSVLRHITAGKMALSTENGDKRNISYKNNTLRFEYAAPFFEQENKTQYQTWLEGFEDSWSVLDNNYYKEYTNLPVGRYAFHVKAVNVYGKESEEALYSFEILPPWYKTWWAYLIYVLVAGAIVYSLIRWRTHQLHEKHRELEKTVAERTRELSHRVEELGVINSVQEGLVREMEMQGIIDLVGEKIREIFDAQVIDIVMYDSKNDLLQDSYAFEKGDRTLVGSWKPFGFRKHVIDTKKTLLINNDLNKKSEEFGNKVIHGEQPKSAVFVPLITGNEVKGMISLQDLDKEDAFSDSDINLLTTLANSMSIALESARRFDETNRLLKETEQRTAELAVINSVQDGLAKELDIQGIYDLVGEKIRSIFNAQVIDIVTYDKKTDLIEDRYNFEKGDRTLLAARPLKGFRKHVIETASTLVINNEVNAARAKYDQTVLTGEGSKSIVLVPLIAGGEATGVISLQNLDQENAFPESDVKLLETLTNSMSVALENARLFDETNRLLKETEQRTAELAVINSVQEGLAKELDMHAIYELVGERILKVFNAPNIVIRTFDNEPGMEDWRYAVEKGERQYVNPKPFAWHSKLLIKTLKPIQINENYLETSKKYGGTGQFVGQPTKSGIFVPMIVGGKVKGSVSLQNVDKENAYSEADLRLLTTITNSMSVALENARLFDETNRLLKETEQRTAELAVINSVQEGLVREMNMKAIYDLVGDRIRDLFDAQVVGIATFNHEDKTEKFQYMFEKGVRFYPEPRPFDKLRERLIETRQKILINSDMIDSFNRFGMKAVSGSELPKSALYVPLTIGDKITSYVTLQNIDREHAFSESDVRLLETLANSMSVALENARLFDETNRLLKETEQRTAELAVINSVQEGLVREMDMGGIYDLVGNRVQTLFNAQAVIIGTFDLENHIEHFNFVFENGERVTLGSRPINKLRQLLIDKKHTIYISTEAQAVDEFGLSAIGDTKMPKSLLFVPLMTGNTIRGYVSLQNIDTENAFSESDIRLLETLANSMSVALENARLFDETNRLLKETEQRTAELAVINSVQEGLAKELDMQAIYDLVGGRLCDLFPDTQTLVIRTFDHESELEIWQYAIEKGERQYVDPRPFNWNSQLLIETKKPLDIRSDYVAKAREHGSKGVTAGQPPKSAVFVPMVVGDTVRGSVSLQNVDRENAFTDSDLRLLTTITNSMSVALENARLFDETNRLLKETEQRTAELAVINSVQDGLVREMNIQAIYDLVGNRICELFDTQTVLIRTFDHRSGLETWQYAIEKGQRLYSNPRAFNWANKELIKSKQPLLINKDYLETAQQHGGAGVTKGLPPKSAMFVPMIVGDIVKGSVSLQNVEKEHAFSESDLRLLTTLTNSMSVALENARLFDESNKLLSDAKQRASELATVNYISQALASQLNIEELIKLVGDEMGKLFRANIVYLALLDKETNTINFPYQYGDDMTPMKMGEGLTSKIILTGQPLLINKDLQEQRSHLGVQQVGIPAASYLGVPIPVGEEVIGVLSVQSTEQENRFNENDMRLLTTIATSVGIALRKAKMFEEVQQAKIEAEEAKKVAEKANAAKSAFLSTVSHELRTPLTSVLGFAKIIKKRLEDKIFPITEKSDPKTEKTINQITENLKVVVSEGERLTHLINDVLDLAKIEAGKMEWNMETVSMVEVAERAIAATSALFETNKLKLEKKIDPDIPEISGDKDKLIQVMVNLISNAVKFTPKGKVSCSVRHKDDEILVSIADSGIGIAPEDHAAVFEQFKQVGDTLTDKPKGTGLGLPICKEIIEHHGGRIWLESELGKGSVFYFALPLTESTASRPVQIRDLVRQLREQVAQSNLHLQDKPAQLLIVDDDDSIRSLLNQELTEAGYIVEEASNGKDALEKVRNKRPDLILLDIMMPEMNGFDVAAVLKNDPKTMDIPIIVLSIVQDKTRGFRIGVDRYLTKPIDTNLLFSEIGNLLEQGKSKKKVMIVDEDSATVNTLTDVLKAKGYMVLESDGKELVEKAVANQPDIIILNSLLSDKQDVVHTLRFEKGLENVLFLVYQ